MSGINTPESLHFSDKDIKDLIELNLEILSDNVLKFLPLDYKEDHKYKDELRTILKNWAYHTVEIDIFRSHERTGRPPLVGYVEQLHSLERMNIITLQLLNLPNVLNKLIREIDQIIAYENHSEYRQQYDTANALFIITTLAMISQKLESDEPFLNKDFSKIHILLKDTFNGKDVSRGFKTEIAKSRLKGYLGFLNKAEAGIHEALKGNFLITKDLSEYLRENKTVIDPEMQQKYLLAFENAINTPPPLSPMSDASSIVGASSSDATAIDVNTPLPPRHKSP